MKYYENGFVQEAIYLAVKILQPAVCSIERVLSMNDSIIKSFIRFILLQFHAKYHPLIILIISHVFYFPFNRKRIFREVHYLVPKFYHINIINGIIYSCLILEINHCLPIQCHFKCSIHRYTHPTR